MDLFVQPAISALIARCCSLGVLKMPVAGWILLTRKNWPQAAGEESKILLHHAELFKKEKKNFQESPLGKFTGELKQGKNSLCRYHEPPVPPCNR